MTEQLSLIDESMPREEGILRNQNGSINHKDIRAVAWYADHFGFKLMTANAMPIIHFIDNKGKELAVSFSDIKTAYTAFRERGNGKNRKVAS